MQFIKCTKKLPGQLSPDRQQNEVTPPTEAMHVGKKQDLVASIQLTRAHGSTLTPRFMLSDNDGTKLWKTQTKEDFTPRHVEIPNKALQQERCNAMRESAYLPLKERTAIPFAKANEDVHSRRAFPRYGAEHYHVDRKDRVAAHPSNSNVILDADKNLTEDVATRSVSTMHTQFTKPNVTVVGTLKSKDQRSENQQELMRSNWSYGEPEGPDGAGNRSLSTCQSVAKQPLPTRDAKLSARLPVDDAKPEDVKLPECTFLEGQSGKSAKYFSRVPYQSGCNLNSSNASPALLTLPGAGTTTKAAFPRYEANAGKSQAANRAGAENMGHQVMLGDGRKAYAPSSVQVGDYQKTSYVTSQKAQYRGVWFDGK